MYSKIIQKRWLGMKRPDADIVNDPGVFGEVSLFHTGNGHTYLVAQRHGYTNEAGKLLPPLWDAQCVGKGQNQEAWRGYQRTKLPHGLGYATCIQEWHIEDLALQPPPDGESLARWPGPQWGEISSSLSRVEEASPKQEKA